MSWALPARLDTQSNRDISAYLVDNQPSAHDDVASELTLAIEGLPGVKTFCPDVHAYAYFVAHDAGGRIFALASGQSHLAACVGPDNVAEAIIDRAIPAPEIGEDWIWLRAFNADEKTRVTRAKLGRWCRPGLEYVQRLPAPRIPKPRGKA